jgi:hypothetical protein
MQAALIENRHSPVKFPVSVALIANPTEIATKHAANDKIKSVLEGRTTAETAIDIEMKSIH